MYERIIFAQGDDAAEILDILEADGVESAADYMAQWWNPGEHEIADELSAGTSDDTCELPDGFVLTWNFGLGYIGLERALQ